MDRVLKLIQMVGIEPFALHHPERKTGRSTHWRTVREAHIKKFPACIVSGLTSDLDVHHVNPFHLHPELELQESNLRTISRPYHYLIGHFCNWKLWNPHFDDMVSDFRKKMNSAREALQLICNGMY